MHIAPVSFRASRQAYQEQADQLLEGWNSEDRDAIRLAVHRHPKFVRSDVPWLPRKLTEAEIRNTSFDRSDAQLTIARWYDFADWRRLEEYIDAVTNDESPV